MKIETVSEKYGALPNILTKEDAEKFLNNCVQETMAWDFPPVAVHKEEATRIERKNIYWFAQKYDKETQERIISLFALEDIKNAV